MATNVLLLENNTNSRYEKEDGHTLLLMETKLGKKTYSDFSNVASAIENLISVFEDYRRSEDHMDVENYDVTVFWDWIDDFFKSLDIMIFDKNTLRYRRHGCDEFKEIMIAKLSSA